MSSKDRRERRDDLLQGNLFGEPEPAGRPRVTPWRSIPVPRELPESRGGLEILKGILLDLQTRNQQFLKSLARAGIADHDPVLEGFLEIEPFLRLQLALSRDGLIEPGEVNDVLAEVRDLEAELTWRRREVLEALPADVVERVLTSEPRIEVSSHEIHRRLVPVEIAVTESLGKPVLEIELPASFGLSPLHDLATPDLVDALVEHTMRERRWEQEEKPLPRKPTLAALLQRLPVAWLDAIAEAIAAPPKKRRAEREQAVTTRLTEPETLSRLVASALGKRERALLQTLLNRGGAAPVSDLLGRFGSDEDDGYFWNDDPPASTLGRLRLHGLVFVGRRGKPSRHSRTAVVPLELLEPLVEMLG